MTTAKKKPAAGGSTKKLPSFNALFARNLDGEENGVWTEIPSFAGPIEVKLRSTRAEGVQELLEKLRRPHKGVFRDAERFPNDQALQKRVADIHVEITKNLIVQAPLIVGWRGIGDEKGDPLPYSIEALRACLDAEGLEGFAITVMQAANMADTFKKLDEQELEDSEKNS